MAVQPLSPATDRRLGGPLPHQLANQTRGHLSAHKALMYRPCDPYMLCGISSRFQLLSPTERQVPHALLTRSPLNLNRSSSSVRLACVRHAASVRPEPGSNSQKMVSKQLMLLKSVFQVICSSKSLLKNFRWLIFRLRLNNPLIVQGVFSFVYSLFSLQGTALSHRAEHLAF